MAIGTTGWLGVAWDAWKTFVECVPPEYAIVLNLLEAIVELVPRRRSEATVTNCTGEAPATVDLKLLTVVVQ